MENPVRKTIRRTRLGDFPGIAIGSRLRTQPGDGKVWFRRAASTEVVPSGVREADWHRLGDGLTELLADCHYPSPLGNAFERSERRDSYRYGADAERTGRTVTRESNTVLRILGRPSRFARGERARGEAFEGVATRRRDRVAPSVGHCRRRTTKPWSRSRPSRTSRTASARWRSCDCVDRAGIRSLSASASSLGRFAGELLDRFERLLPKPDTQSHLVEIPFSNTIYEYETFRYSRGRKAVYHEVWRATFCPRLVTAETGRAGRNGGSRR